MTRSRSPRLLTASTALVAACLAVVLGPLTTAQATTDDYPWRADRTGTNDPFGFAKRQCTSYAAWRLYRSGHRLNNLTRYQGHTYAWGNAAHWDNTAAALHKRISRTPRVGAVAQWNAYERSRVYTSGGTGTFTAGRYGHVAFVAAVYGDGSVLVRQYNLYGNRSYSVMRLRAPRYLYLS